MFEVLQSMNVLGIADNHASGVTLVIDGELRLAMNQERCDRNKNSGAFPFDAIEAVLRQAALKPNQIDLVAVGSEITPCFILRLLRPFHIAVRKSAGQFSFLFNLYVVYQVLSRYIFRPIYALDRTLSRRFIRRSLAKRGFDCPVQMVDHHDSHAYSVFLTSPFKQATVITADAMGDGVSLTVGIAKDGEKIKRVFEQSGFAAINPYYSRTTELLGFIPNRHEGKVTGLAAYGDPDKLIDIYKRDTHFVGPGFSRLNFFTKQSPRWGMYRTLSKHSREDVSAACQRNLEQEMTKFVRYWVNKTGIGDLCLAGGIFENVKLNQRVHEIPEVDHLYIFPNMSDGGLSTGAALFAANAKRQPLKSPFLGTTFDEKSMEAAIIKSGFSYVRVSDVAETVADLLAKGEVVARFDGAMEYGPRALGHRSILTQATDPEVNDWLNVRLKRSEFMPFAPAVIEENAQRCFVGMEGAKFTSRFMNICFDCTDELKKSCPGVVHVDGTARPQVVSKSEDETYYEIIRRYSEKTGLPAIINTSYNMHEEPIVRTPDDAMRSFAQGHLRYLSMGPFLVHGE